MYEVWFPRHFLAHTGGVSRGANMVETRSSCPLDRSQWRLARMNPPPTPCFLLPALARGASSPDPAHCLLRPKDATVERSRAARGLALDAALDETLRNPDTATEKRHAPTKSQLRPHKPHLTPLASRTRDGVDQSGPAATWLTQQPHLLDGEVEL